MRRLLVLALAAATTMAAAGCSDSTGPGDSLAGSYSLRTVNGSSLPVTVVVSAGYQLDVIGGSINLDAQGNYTGITTYRETYSGQPSTQYNDTITGYWTLTGNQLTLVDNSTGATYTGTVSGSSITLNDQGSGYTEFYSK